MIPQVVAEGTVVVCRAREQVGGGLLAGRHQVERTAHQIGLPAHQGHQPARFVAVRAGDCGARSGRPPAPAVRSSRSMMQPTLNGDWLRLATNWYGSVDVTSTRSSRFHSPVAPGPTRPGACCASFAACRRSRSGTRCRKCGPPRPSPAPAGVQLGQQVLLQVVCAALDVAHRQAPVLVHALRQAEFIAQPGAELAQEGLAVRQRRLVKQLEVEQYDALAGGGRPSRWCGRAASFCPSGAGP